MSGISKSQVSRLCGEIDDKIQSFLDRHVRRAGIALQERPVVRLGLCIAGYYKNAEVNLTDRSNMSSPLLVGRKFMAAGGLVIDSAHKLHLIAWNLLPT